MIPASAPTEPARTSNAIVPSLLAEHVAPAAHRDDVAGVVGVHLDLLAQPADVHADRLMLALEVVAPDLFEQHLPRHDAAAILHEHVEQPELLRRELHLTAAHDDPLPRRIDRDLARGDRLVALLGVHVD